MGGPCGQSCAMNGGWPHKVSLSLGKVFISHFFKVLKVTLAHKNSLINKYSLPILLNAATFVVIFTLDFSGRVAQNFPVRRSYL